MANSTSELLKIKKETIMEQWKKRVWAEVASAEGVISLVILDELPKYLDYLAKLLESEESKEKELSHQKRELKTIGKTHGSGRASSSRYLLTEVIFEYQILRQVLFECLEETTQLPKNDRDVILSAIENAVNDAAVEFVETHKEVERKFTATLTHDLRGPLTAAKANAELSAKQAKGNEFFVRCANRIVVSMNRLDSMVRDLLDASKLRSGRKLELQFSRCDLNAIAREVMDEMAVTYGDRFIIHSTDDLIGDWSCNSLIRLIENLVGNAVKYGDKNKPISIFLNKINKSVQLIVHNEGTPISKKEQAMLFQQYRRTKSAQEQEATGWGLGLTLVKGVIEAHHGNVRVESGEGKGTSFIVELPFEPTKKLLEPPK